MKKVSRIDWPVVRLAPGVSVPISRENALVAPGVSASPLPTAAWDRTGSGAVCG